MKFQAQRTPQVRLQKFRFSAHSGCNEFDRFAMWRVDTDHEERKCET
jgi:hypothetical protein